jgi:metallophosphoesterase (TIGR00282 family)
MAEREEVTAPAGIGAPDATARTAGTSILFVGDLVGGIGRRTLLECLPLLRERYDPTFVVANGENVAGGLGITPKAAKALFAGGVDAITLGNHTYHRREIYPYLDAEPRILRPANFLRIQPGHGTCVVERDGIRLGVINLSGNLYLKAGRSAFTEIEAALGELGDGVDHILVDMHAEATSEKVALGWLLDGRVTAVVGTHTHVPTADARVLPNGTAYITDVGMTGPRGGVIGVKREQAIESLMTQMPIRFETSEEDPWLMGVLISCSATPRSASSIEQILMARPPAAPQVAPPNQER